MVILRSGSCTDTSNMPTGNNSSATESTICLSKTELDELVRNAVEDAVKRCTELFERKLLEVSAKCAKQEGQISILTAQIRKLEIHQNKLEQYSRRSHIRIIGLPIRSGTDCKRVVSTFISENLKNRNGEPLHCAPSDIDAAHPLPLRPPSSRESDPDSTSLKSKNQRIPAVIVRFHDRELRDSIIKARRSLKGRRSNSNAPMYSIVEDLTSKNAALLQRLRDQPAVYEAAWSWEGKIYARRKGELRGRRLDIDA